MKKYINRVVSSHKIFLPLLFIASGSLHAQTNTFPSTGNAGVNTLLPNAKFTVHGDVLVGGENANLDPAANNVAYNNLANTGQMLFGWNRTSGEGECDLISNRGAGSVGGFTFYDYSNSGYLTNILRLSGNGNVGIGMPFPQEKLSVNGNIRCKEVLVETANWPDYVFETNYHLPSLKSTEHFIKVNKHLPDMPSATEVALYGQNLGEINAKLLRKVEELTLHLIDKDNELKEQKKQILALQEVTKTQQRSLKTILSYLHK